MIIQRIVKSYQLHSFCRRILRNGRGTHCRYRHRKNAASLPWSNTISNKPRYVVVVGFNCPNDIATHVRDTRPIWDFHRSSRATLRIDNDVLTCGSSIVRAAQPEGPVLACDHRRNWRQKCGEAQFTAYFRNCRRHIVEWGRRLCDAIDDNNRSAWRSRAPRCYGVERGI